MPNRKLRNQPANRVHDIEFAAEISQSLLVQVRNLQVILAEKEEELRDVKIEKSKLEYDAEGFQQRVKTLDESQNRYKDENWSLETQVHELSAAQREATDREKKLQQTVSILQAEKNSTQRDLDEVKLNHAKLSEEHAASVKHHDTELGAAKRNIVMADSERSALLRKVNDLTGQNQELAKAVSSQRGRAADRPEVYGASDDDFRTANDNSTPEHSPPPSPIKGTPRHSLLESETLKSSLGHAQRTIQSLRTNVHREKTEKLELRRMLQDARDELEKVRSDPIASSKRDRANKTTSREFKKPPRLLGSSRSARSEVLTDDPEWEDQPVGSSPAQTIVSQHRSSHFAPVIESIEKDSFGTANETSDQAFETANERETETDDFHTGAEEFSSDDAQTETDSPSKNNTIRGRPTSLLARKSSGASTASTEDESEFDDRRTPTSQIPGLQARFPLRVNRGAFRRSRQDSEDPVFQSSPAGPSYSAAGTPQPVQSLAAELGEFDGSDNDSNLSATPSRRSVHISRPGSVRGTTASPPPPVLRLPRVIMVDNGTMTEPDAELPFSLEHDRPVSMVSGNSDYSDAGTLNMEENLAKFPSPPTSPPKRHLAMSDVHTRDFSPIEQPNTRAAELESLRQEHAKQLEDVHAKRDVAHAAALAALEAEHSGRLDRALAEARSGYARELESLKSAHSEERSEAATNSSTAHAAVLAALEAQHSDRLSRAVNEANSTHAHDLELLKSDHSQDKSKSVAEAIAAHAAALAALEAQHTDNLNRSIVTAQSAHERELETLKSNYIDEKSRAAAEAEVAHARALETLEAVHADRILQLESQHKANHAAEIELLKSSHGEQLEASKKASDEAHAVELTGLIAAHAAQIEHTKKELNDNHVKQLEALQATHGAQIEELKKSSDATQANALEELKAAHLAQIDNAKNELTAYHAQELDALQAAHVSQVEQSRKDHNNSHAAEIAALVALHATQLSAAYGEGEAKLGKELESLTVTHSKQLESLKVETDDHLAKQLENLRAAHSDDLDVSRTESNAKLAAELEAIKLTHSKVLESSKQEAETRLTQELAALQTKHTKQIEIIRTEGQDSLAREIESIKTAHASELSNITKARDAAHAAELASLADTHSKQLANHTATQDAAHAAEMAALTNSYDQKLAVSKSEAEATLAKELASLQDSHARELDVLRREHTATHASALTAFEAALAKQLESSKFEGDTAHQEQLEAIKSANAEVVEAHKRDSQKVLEQALGSARVGHERELQSVKAEHATSRTKELEASSAKHTRELAALGATLAAVKIQELEALSSEHDQRIATLHTVNTAAKAKELDELSAQYEGQIERLMAVAATAKAQALEELTSGHQHNVDLIQADAAATKEKELQEVAINHQAEINALKANALTSRESEIAALKLQHQDQIGAITAEAATSKDAALVNLEARHASSLRAIKEEHETAIVRLADNLAASHAAELATARSGHEASRTTDLEALDAKHAEALKALQEEQDASRADDLEQLKSEHSIDLTGLRTEHQTALNNAMDGLKVNHARNIESLNDSHKTSVETAIAAIKSDHAQDLADLKAASDAALTHALEKARSEHALALGSLHAQSSADRDSLIASHALELEALRKALTVIPPTLGYSSLSTVETEPIEEPEFLRSPKREGFILPRDTGRPQTPKSSALGYFGRRRKDTVTPIIAEDDTRQSPIATQSPDSLGSQQPFQEISTNTDARPTRTQSIPMADHSSQTALTSGGLDKLLLRDQRHVSQESFRLAKSGPEVIVTPFDDGTPATLRHGRSQESIGSSSQAWSKPGDSGIISAPAPVPVRRPGSSGSARGSQQALPPLPANHKQVIEAARTGSSHSTKGAMGPPLLPASAYKNTSAHPYTTRERPLSPNSGRGTPTPRLIRTASTQGYADVQSPTKMSARSRQSSVSSFTSELDARFNIRGDMGIGAAGFAGPNTDPRMIQAITQTMIGEYLWKYTRKAGRGEMSENRHRRYFWVHPYTRTLYWSDSDPSAAGRSELKAKSIPIEAVRVVTDDNPMPPGLHRKSLIIVSPGRTVKFTCTTGQRHETWFNALSYLLLRTGDEGQNDAEEIAGNITQEDVDEFNPSSSQRPANGNRRAPPSLSSYNSRTTRNESPNIDMMSIPTLTPTRERSSAARPGTLGRMSGYLRRTSTSGSIFNSLRSRSHGPPAHDGAIYEASEVNDSAEELRHIIEQQDRESDRLENVRACCDGMY